MNTQTAVRRVEDTIMVPTAAGLRPRRVLFRGAGLSVTENTGHDRTIGKYSLTHGASGERFGYCNTLGVAQKMLAAVEATGVPWTESKATVRAFPDAGPLTFAAIRGAGGWMS